MGKDRRPWRKLVKKLRRQKIRRKRAIELAEEEKADSDKNDQVGGQSEALTDMDRFLEAEEERRHRIEEEEWLEREKEAQRVFELKRIEEERAKSEKEEQERREKLEKEERELREEELRIKKVICWSLDMILEEEYNEFLSFLCGDIENPPIPYLLPEDLDPTKEICPFYVKTGACRFYDNCTKNHPKPTLSRIILIQNFFSHFSLDQFLLDENQSDFSLEYEDSELYKAFLEFYNDVLSEFRQFGTVIQFKVCCNCEPHLRGNVYVQYENIKEAVEAFRIFNGRFYDRKQLTLQFVKIDSWRAAICGLFKRKQSCPKGKLCSFLHVFRNPTKEFVAADNDWAITPRNAPESTPSMRSERRSPSIESTRSWRSKRSPLPDLREIITQSHLEDSERDRKRSRHASTSSRSESTRIRSSRSRSKSITTRGASQDKRITTKSEDASEKSIKDDSERGKKLSGVKKKRKRSKSLSKKSKSARIDKSRSKKSTKADHTHLNSLQPLSDQIVTEGLTGIGPSEISGAGNDIEDETCRALSTNLPTKKKHKHKKKGSKNKSHKKKKKKKSESLD